MNKKLFVTGGAGFIGSEFVRQGVQRGYGMTVVDKLSYAGDPARIKELGEKIKFHKVDIKDRQSIEDIFKKEKPEGVIHWAAESHVDRSIDDASPFLDTNVKGTQVILDISKKYEVEKLINISTDEVYGELPESGQFYETSPLNPNSPYSVSKASADMLGRAYYRTYGLPVITVRPSNNYGPWQYPEKLIPVIILKALRDEKVPVYGKGLNIREWLYVSDCVDAVFEILEKGEIGEIYNVGSGNEQRNIDVVKTVLKLLDKSEDLIEFVKDRPGHDFRYSLNSDKLSKETGWKSSTDFSEGIEKTVKWYVNHMDWVNSKIR
ncbi:MAG: dTDP-glucose 4,6-dehydratase [Nitrospirae bacterium]|jgi:dTDP-glucose 4,6-dehydratase|nr:dTDP-glucose 4,6-dehydratase [Nitrospirota bacterium]